MQWKVVNLIIVILTVFISQGVVADETFSDSAEGVKVEDTPIDYFRHDAASDRYGSSSSFFFLHGYITATFSEAESQFGLEPNSTPQILLTGVSSRTGVNESGFQHDAALFIGSKPDEKLSGVVELHFVRNALNPVVTEAKLTYELKNEEKATSGLRLIAGRFWWPFGNHNLEWFSAANASNVVSVAAAEVVPAHFNEVGLALEGELKFTSGFGANGIVAVGNGPFSFELPDNVTNNAFSLGSGKTVTSRIEVEPAIKGFRIGGSFASGQLRSGTDTVTFTAGDPRQFAADFGAYGLHFDYLREKGFNARGYWYITQEFLKTQSNLFRYGGTFESQYKIPIDQSYLKTLAIKARYSQVTEERLNLGDLRRHQICFGVNASILENLLAKSEYVVQIEDKVADLKNNVFNLSLTMTY